MSLDEKGSDSERIEMNPRQERWEPADFMKRECNTFIEDSSSDGHCQCGRHRDKHLPTHINTAVDTEWTSELHSSEQPTDAFGELDFDEDSSYRHFLRLSSDTDPSVVYDLMTRPEDQDDGWGGSLPDMVVSVVGGEGSAEVKTWVQKVIRQGLVKALDKTGGKTWILTEGFDEGIGRCVGEAVKDSRNVCALAITPWGFVHNRHQLVEKGGHVRYSVENTTSDSCCLDKNHDGFLLVDDGSEGHRGGEKNFRVKLEKYSSSINIPALNMLISGEPSMLEEGCGQFRNLPTSDIIGKLQAFYFWKRVSVSLKSSTPWLVLAGSGGVADLLSDILENQSPASADDDVGRVTEVIRKHFPSESQTAQLVEQVQSIYQNRKLITFYHEEQERPEDFDTVMLKALMPACTRCASGKTFPYINMLSLAVRWNRVDSELFNDDICDDDFLTYGVLEELYSRVAEDTLVYKLLLERLSERLGTPDLDSLKEISLFEVSRVVKKLMGQVKPFYLTVLGLEDFPSHKKALEGAKELLKGDCSYRDQPCKSPWVHLFIWAVLQNNHDWAVFFWEKEAEESVLNALGAFKMLQEMSKMEYGTKTRLSMNELAQKFENLAHDVLGSCCQSDERKSFKLLSTESPVWGTNCFQMAISAKSLLFFNHDGLESVLSQVWRGSLGRAPNAWAYLFSILFPCMAPVSVFVSNAVMYTVFLFLFAYMLLVDFKPPPPSGPSISEYVLYFWVFTFFCEEIRQAFFNRYMKYMTFYQKMRLYWQDFWNRCDLIAIILFIIGLICRMFEGSYEYGRCFLCIAYMVFTLRLIHISAVHKAMGPKIIMVGKMMKDVASFLFFMGVWIMAYGVATQALLYSYDPNPSRIFRRVFYRPYLYIFGEFNLEEIDGGQEWDITCTNNVTEIEDGDEPCRSVENTWMVIILVVVFLLVTNILLINLLIAILSNTVNNVEEESDLYWRAQHYNLVMEYQSRPVWAPPFIIFSHLGSLFLFLCNRWCCDDDEDEDDDDDCDCGITGEIKSEYTAEEVKKWEMDQKKNILTAQRETERSSDSERIKQTSDKVDKLQIDLRALETKLEKILDLLTKPQST